MSNEFDDLEVNSEDLGNMVLDIPEEIEVQKRMVRDIEYLLSKGSTELEATSWVFGNRDNYESDPEFSASKL